MIGTEVFANLLVPSIAPCSLGALLDGLDTESRTNLESALATPNVSNAAIYRAIIEEQLDPVSAETISDHRKGRCRCSSL